MFGKEGRTPVVKGEGGSRLVCAVAEGGGGSGFWGMRQD